MGEGWKAMGNRFVIVLTRQAGDKAIFIASRAPGRHPWVFSLEFLWEFRLQRVWSLLNAGLSYPNLNLNLNLNLNIPTQPGVLECRSLDIDAMKQLTERTA
jgi:hypothetical protein